MRSIYLIGILKADAVTFPYLVSFLKRDRGWRTFKRPGVEAFLEHLAQFYEIVVFSDQLSMVTSFSSLP